MPNEEQLYGLKYVGQKPYVFMLKNVNSVGITQEVLEEGFKDPSNWWVPATAYDDAIAKINSLELELREIKEYGIR